MLMLYHLGELMLFSYFSFPFFSFSNIRTLLLSITYFYDVLLRRCRIIRLLIFRSIEVLG
ncbi:hypothetical protein OIU79_010630 [Salix purpurea]|uniref:Uncharacterized protein n=1 Tax=Salix purpurea TaxID=77065 RepID=A0A9Q0T9V6_SALPP|nr:hypothetical protein OIU79_010630 [Salix purpurea]